MTIDHQIRDEELQYDINREAAKISALSSVKLISMSIFLAKKYFHLFKQAKFTDSPLEKIFWKTSKTTEDQGKKQVDILKALKPKELEVIEHKSGDNEKNLRYNEAFKELSNERIGEYTTFVKKLILPI